MVIDINYIIPTAVCVSYTYFIEAAEHMMYKIKQLDFLSLKGEYLPLQS